MASAIRLECVGFQYPLSKEPTLREITCSIQSGEKIALIGENGSGKTTLVKLLMGLYAPTEGKLWYGDTLFEEIKPSELRSHMAAVFQDFNKYAFTAGENVGFGRHEQLSEKARIQQAAMKGGADKVIRELTSGYNTMLTTCSLVAPTCQEASGRRWPYLVLTCGTGESYSLMSRRQRWTLKQNRMYCAGDIQGKLDPV